MLHSTHTLASVATVVAGPTRAEVIYNDPTGALSQHETCNIVDGDVFECTLVYAVEGITTTVFGTETVASYLAQQTDAQGGSSGAGSSTSGAPASGSAPTPPSMFGGPPSSGSGSSSSQSQSGLQSASSPAPTGTTNAAPALANGIQAMSMLGIVLATYMFL